MVCKCVQFSAILSFLWDVIDRKHSLHPFHEVVTQNGFPTVLKEFPEVLSTCWLLFLCGFQITVELNLILPSQLTTKNYRPTQIFEVRSPLNETWWVSDDRYVCQIKNGQSDFYSLEMELAGKRETLSTGAKGNP